MDWNVASNQDFSVACFTCRSNDAKLESELNRCHLVVSEGPSQHTFLSCRQLHGGNGDSHFKWQACISKPDATCIPICSFMTQQRTDLIDLH